MFQFKNNFGELFECLKGTDEENEYLKYIMWFKSLEILTFENSVVLKKKLFLLGRDQAEGTNA